MKKGDIFEFNGIFLLYMGDKVYVAHQGYQLLESEVRLGGWLAGWTIYMQAISLSSESELRRKKARCNIGKKGLLRLEKAQEGETKFCGPCLAEPESLESVVLYDAQIQRLDSLQARIKRLQWRT